MARFISRLCENKECQSHGVNPFTGEPLKSLCQIVGAEQGYYRLRCGACNHEFDGEKPPAIHKTLSYSKGYYCSSTDQTFHSYADQKAYERRHKLEPL